RKLTFQRQPYPIIKIDYSDGEIKNFSDRLQKIKVPSLILWGQKDRYVSVEQGYRMQKLIPASSLEVFNCGHTPQREESKHFNEIVLNFMNGNC
ncbi:MAG: alpha/beta hydrolase, partial [Chloroflexi bacterium]|nr:alpha/beta hydrolase [Chloroflexota bacterium]